MRICDIFELISLLCENNQQYIGEMVCNLYDAEHPEDVNSHEPLEVSS